MNRDSFLKRFDKASTINGYLKSFKKLDEYLQLKNITEDQFISNLNLFEEHEKYNELQNLIDSIKDKVSPRVTRNYFDNIFMYFLINGVKLDYTQKKLRLKFPRISVPQFEGLDRAQVVTLLNYGSDNFKTYMMVLVGGGLRETEGLKLKPSMILFEEYPTRLKLPGNITKFSIPRETFLPPLISDKLKKLIQDKELKDDDYIFVKTWNDKSLEDFEKYFAKIRTNAGLDTPQRKKHQQNDITLHSFRAFFITTFTDNGLESFGHALAGHTKYMQTYYRKSLSERQRSYAGIMNKIDFE